MNGTQLECYLVWSAFEPQFLSDGVLRLHTTDDICAPLCTRPKLGVYSCLHVFDKSYRVSVKPETPLLT
jgi:hypothetical protein